MFAFDPRLIPTPGAQARGTLAAEKLLSAYHEKNNAYPATIAIILWGFETMKTGGDTIAMILHLLGVRIRHRTGAWLKDLELISLQELGRPRIDVLVSMCGIFRDTFGTHIDLISRACALAAAQDEPPEDNYIRHHCQSLPAACEGEVPLRLFGPAPDQYATDLPALIETGDWQTRRPTRARLCSQHEPRVHRQLNHAKTAARLKACWAALSSSPRSVTAVNTM